jgi:putative PIN family toxin of toxin-antitoxin system
MISAVLDVNVLVAAVISHFGVAYRLLLAWQAQQFAVITSEQIIEELGRKLRLERIGGRYGIAPEEIESVETLLRREATVVLVPAGEVRTITGDPEDDTVLATARLGRARYLVTNDGGLLSLRSYVDTSIVTPGAFRDLLPG